MNIDNTPHLTRLKQALAATQNDLQTIALRRVEASGIIAEVSAIEADRRTVTTQRDKMVDALAGAVSGPCCLDAHMANKRTIKTLSAELSQANKDLRETIDRATTAERERDVAAARAAKAERERAALDMKATHDRDAAAVGIGQLEVEIAALTDRASKAEDIARMLEGHAKHSRSLGEKAERERDEVGVQLTACRERLAKAEAVVQVVRRCSPPTPTTVLLAMCTDLGAALRAYDAVPGDTKAVPEHA